jgi:MYXO-CTERM domain-containing protein
VSLSEASRVADLAFAAWNSALCPSGPPNAQAYDVGPLDVPPDSGDCTTSSTCNAVTHDVIVFRDQVWPHDDPVNTLALTTVTYGVQDGEIFEAYTEVNSAQHALTTVEPPSNGTFDLQAILTHEAGHFLGLAHATDTHSIMYAYYQAGAINLTPDDVGAICSVYDPPPAGGCSSQSTPAGAGLAAVSALWLATLAATRRRRRRA